MALSIKDPEADRLVRELAAATGESITDAARIAFAERLQRIRARSVATGDRERVREIIRRARERRPVDDRTEAEILGYDENGIPGS